MEYYVYILSNKVNTVLYVGVTNNISRRTHEHSVLEKNSFCAKYNVNKLVYLETTSSIDEALEREKQIKKWSRKSKEKLINSFNPKWEDLFSL